MSISALKIGTALAMTALLSLATSAHGQRQMEKLGRGVIAVNQGEGKAFVSWRLLGTEPDAIAFNVYRSTNNAAPVKLNTEPLTKATCYQDSGVDFTQPVSYTVRPVLSGQEQAPGVPFKFAANAPVRQYLSIPLKEGLMPNDASVGDLDGDGEYEIILKRDQNGRDNAQAGITGETHLEAYKLDGSFLWRINLGKNIRSGAHYTQFMVFDLDGDGKAEIMCKTADGTVDGKGKVIGDGSKNYVDSRGMIVDGPEFLTVFDGATGAALATTGYIPVRGGNGSAWGDGNANRVDRFLACVAYLDGVHTTAVMCRGYYTRTVLAAWDWRDGKLTNRWTFDSTLPGEGKDGKPNQQYAGQGNHGISVADVDGDGKDEIVYGAMCVDDDGKGLWTTGLRHGDAMHVSDLVPDRPGIEIFGIHEGGRTPGAALLDARSGEVIWATANMDVGRGLAADVDPRYPGAEFFGGPGGSKNAKGETIPVRGGSNFAIWWDGDLLRELLNSNSITKWNYKSNAMDQLFTADSCVSNNGTKSTPALSADLFGDWREEFMERTADNKELRIYTTVIPTEYRMYTLMHDSQYRESVAWQNVAYNQPPWPSFFIGQDMKAPPKPNIVTPR